MPFNASQVIQDASVTLMDLTFTRWKLPELLDYVNEAVEQITTMKPNVMTAQVVMDLAPGARQRIPAGNTVLIRVVHNTAVGTNQRSITALPNSDLLDMFFPNWRNNAQFPRAQIVEHVIPNPSDLTYFDVVPPNDGTGQVLIETSQKPARLARTGTGPHVLQQYRVTVPLPDIYQTAILNYVLFRAFSKDSGTPAGAQRAVGYMQAFKDIIGTLASTETAVSAAGGGSA